MSLFNIYHVATNDFHPLYDDLISALAGGLKDLGHDCTVTINGYKPGAINILVGSTIFASRYHRLPDKLKGKPYIVYQLEQLDDTHGLLSEWPEYWTLLQNASAIWDYAPSSSSYLESKGMRTVSYLPPGYHPSIEHFRPVKNRDIDVLYYGSPHPRREQVMKQLKARGVKVVYLHGAFGKKRNHAIQRARIILNVHAWDDLNVLETVRLSYLLSNHTLVVSEESDHNPYADGVIYAPYEQLVDTCIATLATPHSDLEAITAKGYEVIRNQPFHVHLQPVLARLRETGLLQDHAVTSGRAAAPQAQAGSSQQVASQEEASLRARVQSHPNDHTAWHALGLLLFNKGSTELSLQCIEAAMSVGPKEGLYSRNACEIYRRCGRLEDALKAGKKSCKLSPQDLDAYYNLGLAYTDSGDYSKAIATYRKALKINPRHNLSWNNMGSALEQQDHKEEALAAYEKAIAIDPRHAEAQNNAGAIYSEMGRLEEAQAAFEAAISANPAFVEAHYNLCSLKRYTADDPHLAMLRSIFASRTRLDDNARIRYCFAYGKALDDIGDYDASFAAYDEANKLQHALLPMDEVRADRMLADILEHFDADFFSQRSDWKGASDADRTPVFIVGMPRSGTTLLEQILCSHASVYGAGELTDLSQAVSKRTVKGTENPFTANIQLLTEEDIRSIGNAYLDKVWKLSPDSRYITDKMPANFFYLGLLYLALPGAKIIHAMRDPMDSCFSCFSRLFNDSMEFAYDQGTLGRYYVRYMTLMKHWHEVLPEGTVLDMPYELMVEDTEKQARRVLDFVGLPWDDNCLEFHKNDRLVKTASVAQVRKPIYKSSIARWKHFARHLHPLYTLVREYRSSDDAEELFDNRVHDTAVPVGDRPQAGIRQRIREVEKIHTEGVRLYKEQKFTEAVACFDAALAITPNAPAMHNSRGFALQDLGHIEEALKAFQRAVEIEPEMAMARLNLGMAQLKLGDWEQGWENYEARWSGSAEANKGLINTPMSPLPQWNGEDAVSDKSILIVSEQGFGDTFQFARYIRMLVQRFARVGFACSEPTLRLMEWSFNGELVTMTRMPSDSDAWNVWDYQCPLMSLPRAFKTRVESIPAQLPYLHVPVSVTDYWQNRIEISAPGRLRVGIAWAGRKGHQYDDRRSLDFTQLAPLFADQRICWFSLQKWAPDDARPSIPSGVDWVDWTDDLTDFAHTAGLLTALDLVISIDSSMVHLAGALDCRVWMLDRFDNEWRWFHQRDDSPWYPQMQIFRQAAFGEWDPVIQRVHDALLQVDLPRQSQPPRPRQQRQPVAMPKAAGPGGEKGTNLNAEQALQLASQHQAGGRLAEANQILRQILNLEPENEHALHLLGVVSYQAGQPEEAIGLIQRAIARNDQIALFHCNVAEMHRQQGRLETAIEHGERAIMLDATMATAHANLGVALYDAKQYDKAEACHLKALELDAQLLNSMNNLGSIMRVRGDKSAAAEWYRKVLAMQPDFLESLSNLGAVLVEDSKENEAESYLMRALSLRHDYPEALCNLGLVRHMQDRNSEALELLQRSLVLLPDYPEALIGMSRVLRESDQLDDAMRMARRATEVAPDNAENWTHLGSLAGEMDDSDASEAAYQRALTIDPDMAEAYSGLAHLRLEQGVIDEAVAFNEKAIAIRPDDVSARFQLIQARKVKPGDSNLAALEALRRDESDWKADKRVSCHYALGKAYDDLGEWDKAFPHFLEGAKRKRAKLNYDSEADRLRGQRVADICNADFIQRLEGAGASSDQPVFVLGMPRSGTTLTEQILASHPDIFGAGELHDLMSVVQQQSTPGQASDYPDNLNGLMREQVLAWGEEYVSRIHRLAPEAMRITDKMPVNYLALGLIHVMLPNAKIIHVKRHPVDTCLSCFTRLFNRHQDATYDLYEIGQHYAIYARLMEHWRQVLPQKAFMEVQYEEIVADMETQARRLIDWVDMPWDDACLDFHKNRRSIRTSSVTQVRQPIYTSSVERWRNYERYLDPLLEGLAEFAP